MLGGEIKEMIWRSKQNGFTLVEVAVVMAIMAIMGVWAFSSYIGAKKEVYVHFIANRLQSDMRGVFINSISTKREVSASGGCTGGLTAKAKAIRIRLGDSTDPYDIIPYCEDSNGVLKAGNIDSLDPSEFLNYKQDVNVTVAADSSDALMNGSHTAGFIYLVFTSPYGKYYTYYRSDPVGFNFATDQADLTKDPFSKEITNIAAPTPTWKKNKYLEYQPISTPAGANLTITIDADSISGGITHVLKVSDIGNAELD